MTRLRLRPTCAVSALLVAAGSCVAQGYCGAGAQDDSATAEHVKSNAPAAHDAVPKQQVYFRPFCRRSRYVTNRSAPCW